MLREGILVSDPSLQGSDALTTAKMLAAAIGRLGGADLIIAATESSDGYTGTVPEQLAEVLGLPSVTFAKHVAVDGGALKVNRQTEEGYDEVTCPLPAVISVTAGVVEPRYPSFKGIMAAKSKPVETVTAGDLGVTPVGWAGAGQTISNVTKAEARAAGEIIEDDGEGHAKIVAFLENLKLDLRSTMNIWVFAQESNGAPTTATLELVTKARNLSGGPVTAFVGGDASGIAAVARRARRHQGLRHRRPGRQASGSRRVGGDEGRDRRRRLARPDHVPADVRRSRRHGAALRQARSHGADQQRRHHRRRRHGCRHHTGVRWQRAGHDDLQRAEPASCQLPTEELCRRAVRGGAPEVVAAPVPELGAAGAAAIVAVHVEESHGPKLDEANIVVSGGRGLGEASKYEMIEQLAKLLKGAPGASRAIVDAGWVPYSYQVGQTGKVVKPGVYLACGISGATQHMVGMKGAKNIIAINKDKEAPIFGIADLGIVGDVHKVLPKLIEALQSRA